MTNGCVKGKVGERELALFLRERGHEARRGQQHKGGADSPDVIVPTLPFLHFECKRVEVGNLYTWLDQAKRDAPDGVIPLVAHRKNGKKWVAVLDLADFIDLVTFIGAPNGSAKDS